MAISSLAGELVQATRVGAADRDRMFTLLQTYFTNVSQSDFLDDLAQKDWCVLLRDSLSGEVQGFSTLQHLSLSTANRDVAGIFSGDTIISQTHWGSAELVRVWARHVFGLAKGLSNREVYWFLITSGFRTYRFLPVFFRDFYPTWRQPTPPRMQELIDEFADLKFPQGYQADTGIVRLQRPAPLRSGISDITAARKKDRDIAFFAEANPGHIQGDELACLTLLDESNLTKAGQRLYRSAFTAPVGPPTVDLNLALGESPTEMA